MMERRGFITRLLAAIPALPFLPRIALAAPIVPPAVQRSDAGVPRQMDLRVELHPDFADVAVYRHGEKLLNGVAYDLDADTVTVFGNPTLSSEVGYNRFTYRTLAGGVAVKWARA